MCANKNGNECQKHESVCGFEGVKGERVGKVQCSVLKTTTICEIKKMFHNNGISFYPGAIAVSTSQGRKMNSNQMQRIRVI